MRAYYDCPVLALLAMKHGVWLTYNPNDTNFMRHALSAATIAEDIIVENKCRYWVIPESMPSQISPGFPWPHIEREVF